ncbi:unnamed protein product, partial [Larinioides sclopetarius]
MPALSLSGSFELIIRINSSIEFSCMEDTINCLVTKIAVLSTRVHLSCVVSPTRRSL